MNNTKIEWTNHTFNPWWGCSKVSPGCAHCYAETLANRYAAGIWGKDAPRRFFGENHWNEPLKWNRKAERDGERPRVFCASMADVFEGRDDLNTERGRLFRLIEETPNLDWLLLTKRPENVKRLTVWQDNWPANVWLGTSVENAASVHRIDTLRETSARVKFLSVEPLLGPLPGLNLKGIDWVIVGGESGPGARPMPAEWVRDIRDQCERQGVAFFFKQWGGVRKKETGRELDGRTWEQYPSIVSDEAELMAA